MSSPALADNTDTSNTIKGPRKHSFAKRLGLIERSGRPAYRGLLNDFHEATNRLVNDLTGTYRWREEVQRLKTVGPAFRHEGIENCLAEYGPQVWNDGVSEPFRTNPEGNTRLVYKHKDDQAT